MNLNYDHKEKSAVDSIHPSPVLILGVGNILMKDEGVGVHVVNQIQEMGEQLSPDVEIIDGGTAGFDLIPLMKGRRKIIIVDAMKMSDAPGSIYRFTPEDVATPSRGYSLHNTGILDVIRMLRMLGDNPEIQIIGIVTEDITTMEIAMSEALINAVPKAVSAVFNSIAE